jgi:hypothetical protein
MKMNFIICSVLLLICLTSIVYGSASNPIVYSWTKSTGKNGYNSILADVSKIEYSSNYVYITANSVPGTYAVGPTWIANPNVPQEQNHVLKFPLNPTRATTKKTAVGLGIIGAWLNGVSIYNANDGRSYNNARFWYRNAFFWEGISFDGCLGHASVGGHYHHHNSPNCFYNYTDSTKHSSLLGFALDGYPIYGPYGYANGTNPNSPIKLLKSCYVAATYPNNLRTQLGNGTAISNSANYGPPVNSTYPSGAFLLDYYFQSSSSCDLDKFNGRFQITPEYPSGTYAYIATINSTGTAQYPFTIAPSFYYSTVASTSTSNTISESTTTYFNYNSSSNVKMNTFELTFTLLILCIFKLF